MTVQVATTPDLELALATASRVADPELPMLTLADLGVLRDVDVDSGGVRVTITPTYSGCPALATMRADLRVALRRAGFDRVRVDTVLHPAWTTDWITDEGRRKLTEHGIAPPGPANVRTTGPVPLTLVIRPQLVRCPQCGADDTVETAHFGSTPCKSLHRCKSCSEPFERIKEH